MAVNGRPSKRLVKRRVTAELSDFLTFPISGDSDDVLPATKPFRTNVGEFLDARALHPPPSSLFPHLVAWRIPFRVGDAVADDGGPAVVFLDVVVEDVSRSRSPYCDQCRVVGWSGNPVSAKRYHFIIKGDGDSIAGSNKPCAACGDSLHMADPRSCNRATTTEDVEDWVYQQLDSTVHLLHGVIHSNGYGHLLRVNGREGGSSLLSGRQILNFWDRLCGVLGVRSKGQCNGCIEEKGLEFRLLHAVTNGHPWYGEWGYDFGAGSFGRTISDYNAAVAYLSSLPLSSFRARGRKPQSHLHDLIVFYQSISDRDLVSVRDLFRFMMALIRGSHESLPEADGDSPRKKCRTWRNPEASNAWDAEDERLVNDVIFKVLRAVSGSGWVSWRALKGAVSRLGAPELLDHCLKEIGGKQAAPGWVVGSRISDSGAIEYRLEPGFESPQSDTSLHAERLTTSYLTEEHLLRDLKYFYGSMLHPETMAAHVWGAVSDFAAASARRILDCKQFVKDFRPEKADSKESNAVRVLCEMDLSELSDLDPPPPELLLLSPDATLADLKLEATTAFREVYLMFRRFRALEIMGYGGLDDSTQLRLLFGSSGSVRIRGKFAWKNSSSVGRYRLERGVERWVVDCSCGAKDDDGERMLACDGCSIWLHTRCAGIPDSDGVPAKFMCYVCRIGKVSGGPEMDSGLELFGTTVV
ncbi:hypothetical protein M569_03413 [Genlisea aurea]|uniref:Zinc finger PHD-type domain-containing protein n=1 Tax=Genlisea aurea TaxID=192259 RepID=S8CVH4_9LAMI|nr:hypothetical protein M569_03413 [Genlisea aurea]